MFWRKKADQKLGITSESAEALISILLKQIEDDGPAIISSYATGLAIVIQKLSEEFRISEQNAITGSYIEGQQLRNACRSLLTASEEMITEKKLAKSYEGAKLAHGIGRGYALMAIVYGLKATILEATIISGDRTAELYELATSVADLLFTAANQRSAVEKARAEISALDRIGELKRIL